MDVYFKESVSLYDQDGQTWVAMSWDFAGDSILRGQAQYNDQARLADYNNSIQNCLNSYRTVGAAALKSYAERTYPALFSNVNMVPEPGPKVIQMQDAQTGEYVSFEVRNGSFIKIQGA